MSNLSREQLSASDIVALFEKDPSALKRLAELLVTVPDIRLAIVEGVMREVATKRDLEALRRELQEYIDKRIAELRSEMEKVIGEVRSEISKLSDRVTSLEARVARLEGQVSLLIKIFIAFNVPILIGIIGILLKMVLAP